MLFHRLLPEEIPVAVNSTPHLMCKLFFRYGTRTRISEPGVRDGSEPVLLHNEAFLLNKEGGLENEKEKRVERKGERG